jgi:hypothetical protein
MIREVGPRHDFLDPVQDHRPDRIEQNFVLVGIKLAHGKAAARPPAGPCFQFEDDS